MLQQHAKSLEEPDSPSQEKPASQTIRRTDLTTTLQPQAARVTPKNVTFPLSQSGCYSEACMQQMAQELARPFRFRHDNHNYLIYEQTPETKGFKDPQGFLLVKTFKAASSTAASVVLRIAKRYAPPSGKPDFLWHRWHHTRGTDYRKRHPQRSFLWTSVRDPAARAISRIFYTMISWQGHEPTDTNIRFFLDYNHSQFGSTSIHGGFQTWFISLQGNDEFPIAWKAKQRAKVQNAELVERVVDRILNDYDFILLAERLDDSLVVLSFIATEA